MNLFKSPLVLLLLLLLQAFAITNVFSQGWEKIYNDVEVTQVFGFLTSNDGGYVIAGHTNARGAGSEDGFLMKIDSEGNKEWFRTYGGSNSDRITGLVETPNGYLMVGSTLSFGGNYDRVYVVQTDFAGNQIKDTVFHEGITGDDRGWGILKISNNRYIIHASTPKSGLFYQANMIMIDENLNILVDKHYGESGVEYIYKLIPTLDGGYAALGTTTSYGAMGNGDIYFLKLDNQLNEQWHTTYGGVNTEVGFGMYQTPDSGYFIGSRSDSHGAGGNELYVLRTDKTGAVLWTKTYGTPNQEYHGGVLKASSGGYYLTATYNAASTDVAGDMWLFKIDDNGNVVWDRKYGTRNDIGRFLIETGDNGVVILGMSSNGYIEKYVYVVKTDAQGYSLTNTISGKVFLDANENCVYETTEKKLGNVLVKILPGPIYATTDSEGVYSVKVGAGNYTIAQTLPNSLITQGCPVDNYTVNFASNNYLSSVNNNFADRGISCALLKVDLSTPLLRRCFRNRYEIVYSNDGTASASNVEVTVQFPEAVIPISSSKAWIKNNDLYTFNIGTLNAGQSGKFYIEDSVSCEAPLGSSHCVKAMISPVSECSNPGDGSWDKSSVKVEGKCIGDTLVRFTITNTGEPGNGNMDGSSEFRIYADNKLVFTGTFQLTGGQTKTIEVESQGKTIRLEADQRPGHPGRSRPRATVEGCGEGDNQEVSFGFLTQVAEDDKDEFVEEDCQTVIGSFDPNDKAVKPEGITDHHYISENDELEYKIRFQNTGTDTAFTVVIRDTLSSHLDVTTLKTLAASHGYSFKIFGTGTPIAEWRFENILLPDSNRNEPKSHGFIKFKISQKAGNAKGTLIENKAGIIFDYNDPVMTNTTSNIVHDTVISGPAIQVVTSNKKSTFKDKNVAAVPNPFTDYTVFEIDNLENGKEMTFELCDGSGRFVKAYRITKKQFHLYKSDLKQGVYFYKIQSGDEIIGTGKLIVE